VREVLLLRFVVLGGHQRVCNFLSKRCEYSHCTPLLFNKVSSPSPADKHTICLIGKIKLNCVLIFSTSDYLLHFFTLHDNPAFFLLHRSQQLVSDCNIYNIWVCCCMLEMRSFHLSHHCSSLYFDLIIDDS